MQGLGSYPRLIRNRTTGEQVLENILKNYLSSLILFLLAYRKTASKNLEFLVYSKSPVLQPLWRPDQAETILDKFQMAVSAIKGLPEPARRVTTPSYPVAIDLK
jgi:hypothetical protein